MAVDQFQYVNGYHFSLCIPGSQAQNVNNPDTAFSEVSGLAKELELEEIVCGGENRFKYRVPKATRSGNLVLKRGVCFNNSPLIDWCRETLDGGMTAPISPKILQLKLLNSHGESCRSWEFTGAYPVKWVASELRSERNALFIETIELAFHCFELCNSGTLDKILSPNNSAQA